MLVRLRDRYHGVTDAPHYDVAGVDTLEVEAISNESFPESDSVIATGYQTAPWVASLDERAGKKLYFVQHDERHLSSRAEATWALPMSRIVIAQWIAETIETAGFPVLGVVPNAIDPAVFALDIPLPDRGPRIVALYHRLPVKGSDTLVAALGEMRHLRSDVEADVFAARRPSRALPPWVRVHVRPDRAALRALYNQSAVALHTSRLEGWGLVPMEAAACGCAVVATASRGVAEFLRAGVSMVEVPVGDAGALAEAATGLLDDPATRIRMAQAAMVDVARFSWDDSTDAFERLVVEAVR